MMGRSGKADPAIRLVSGAQGAPPGGDTADDPTWLRVENAELIAGHRWIRLRYSSSFFDDPVRPLIRFVTGGGATFLQAMNGPVLGSAEWMGRVPDDTVAIAIAP